MTGLKLLHGHSNNLNSYRFFHEYDSGKRCSNDIDINELFSLTLYMVEAKASNVFFNKRADLIYGKCLRNLLETNNEITYTCY